MKNFIIISLLLLACKNETNTNLNNSIVQEEKTLKQKLSDWENEKDSLKNFFKENDILIKNKQNRNKLLSVKMNNEISNEVIDFSDYKGFYVGKFNAVKFKSDKRPSYSNKINISLDSLNFETKILFGHSVVAGNIRTFSGKFILYKSGDFTAICFEHGDNKYDGKFHLKVDKGSHKITGTWLSNNKDLAVTERKFNLEKKTFKYTPKQKLTLKYETPMYSSSKDPYSEESGDYETVTKEISKFNTSIQKLTNKDIENMFKSDLEILRNSIYARHGYSFKNRKMRYFFDRHVEWYIPVSTDVRNKLTKIELENIELIKRYEKHAEKYYDYFGR